MRMKLLVMAAVTEAGLGSIHGKEKRFLGAARRCRWKRQLYLGNANVAVARGSQYMPVVIGLAGRQGNSRLWTKSSLL